MLYPPEERLLAAAVAAADGLPDDGRDLHTVAAAVMDVHGAVVTGVNVYHFTGGPCAELVALGVAAGAGLGPIAGVVAVGEDRGVLAPCGRCRQVLLDQHPDALVVIPGDDGPTTAPAYALLPHAYVHPDSDPPRLLRFSPVHWETVLAGTKTATTRAGEQLRPGPVTMLFEFDDCFRALPGVVDSVERLRLADLTDAQAALEGCTADELRTALRTHYYPGIRDDDPVDFVRFRSTA